MTSFAAGSGATIVVTTTKELILQLIEYFKVSKPSGGNTANLFSGTATDTRRTACKDDNYYSGKRGNNCRHYNRGTISAID